MKEICVIAYNYTTDQNQVHVFLDNVVRLFVDRGIKCNVIAHITAERICEGL